MRTKHCCAIRSEFIALHLRRKGNFVVSPKMSVMVTVMGKQQPRVNVNCDEISVRVVAAHQPTIGR